MSCNAENHILTDSLSFSIISTIISISPGYSSDYFFECARRRAELILTSIERHV